VAPAAGADTAHLPKLPFLHRKPAVKLACQVVRQDDFPAVACRWSAVERATTFSLRRGGGGEGRVDVYSGAETSFVDTSVDPGSNYVYKVGAQGAGGERVGQSRAVTVKVPDEAGDEPAPVRAKPAAEQQKTRPAEPKAAPGPTRATKPPVAAEPKRAPGTAPKPLSEPKPAVPKPSPLPETKPAPLPGTKPAPEVKPAPVVARMRLACGPQRAASTTEATAEPVVVCEWAAPADLPVAGYQLWRADKAEGTKQVIFRTADATRYADHAVAAGHQYVYMVKALDAAGKVIAQSDGVWVPLPAATATTATPPVEAPALKS
jgi:fibronectin type 3 domain-containing protein